MTLLHALRQLDAEVSIRALVFRPSIRHFGRASKRPRPEDSCMHPDYFWAPYLPKIGGFNDRFFGLALNNALKSLPEGFQPDAILVPWLFPDACAVSRIAIGKKIPVVAVAQGSDAHRYLEMPMRRRAIVSMVNRVEAVVTRSKDLAKRLIKCGSRPERVFTVYNGVDVETFRPLPRSGARAGLGVEEDSHLLLYVGNFLPVKGLDLLIEAFGLVVAHRRKPIKLALIGGGPQESILRLNAKNLGLENDVIFLGRKGATEVALWMQASDVVCLSSHNEGVPNVLLESLSCGRIPVCTDVGGIAEIVEPVLGRRFLVKSRDSREYADVLRDALDNPVDEMKMHELMQSFSWESCAKQYLKLLRRDSC